MTAKHPQDKNTHNTDSFDSYLQKVQLKLLFGLGGLISAVLLVLGFVSLKVSHETLSVEDFNKGFYCGIVLFLIFSLICIYLPLRFKNTLYAHYQNTKK